MYCFKGFIDIFINWGRYYHHFHFASKVTEAQTGKELAQGQVVVRIRTQTVNLQDPDS